ncbi:type I-F CRISPR-associated protein Csy2 [Marinobacter oulmenensis]|uniref:CRISPR-associated protein Csy2 n=1 Tax=Marinobacter oulmenensis TaxID=643747 RepID=A0A840U723_9GAMM|nr:type I-F CRISPR-associated protein Csy2 [Marinobacter oulmenensis]MBB5321554.1 CRISPR-associated protein Csy2 [Marinobacter oulmenensis]
MSTRRLLVLPHLKVHNANALSSPFTIGFPAMTAWLGFVHALERKLKASDYPTLRLVATGVISHRCDLQTYQGPGDYVHSIVGTANPLDRDGQRSAFIEEARCHLDVSLLIEYRADDDDLERVEKTAFFERLNQLLSRMKVAGGDLLDFDFPELKALDDSEAKEVQKVMRSLMPGFALLERRELMQEAMKQGTDALDALLEHVTVHHQCEQDENGDVIWHSHRKTHGWIVPIATGFQGISPVGPAKNQRDADTPHRFAESVVTLGEFKMAHRIEDLDEALWEYNADLPNDLYLCQQVQTETPHSGLF